MATSWTPERRAKQSEMIQQWKPWEQSTGPKTEEGKAKSSQNAYKGGTWLLIKHYTRLLRKQKKCVEDISID